MNLDFFVEKLSLDVVRYEREVNVALFLRDTFNKKIKREIPNIKNIDSGKPDFETINTQFLLHYSFYMSVFQDFIFSLLYFTNFYTELNVINYLFDLRRMMYKYFKFNYFAPKASVPFFKFILSHN